MVPANYRFPTSWSGDTFAGLSLSLSSDGTALNLTGVTAELVFINEAGSTVLTATTGSGITLTDALNGELEIGSFTVPTTAGEYEYHLTLTFSDGTVRTYLAGQMTVVGQ